jgi:hypothetical protein
VSGVWITAVIVAGLLASLVIAALAQRRHAHRPVPVAARSQPSPPMSLGQLPPRTIVLMRCPCGFLSTVTLDGTWSLDDLRGSIAGESAARLEAAR